MAILLVKCDFSYSNCAAADKISTDLRRRAVPNPYAIAELLVTVVEKLKHCSRSIGSVKVNGKKFR